MAALKFFKVSSLPGSPEPNAVYLLDIDGYNFEAYESDSTGTLTRIYDPSVVIRAIANQVVFASNSYQRTVTSGTVVVGATETLLEFSPLNNTLAKACVVSGNGDAVISIFIDGVKIDEARTNWAQQRVSIALDYDLTSGQILTVAVQCIARGTGDYFVSLIHS